MFVMLAVLIFISGAWFPRVSKRLSMIAVEGRRDEREEHRVESIPGAEQLHKDNDEILPKFLFQISRIKVAREIYRKSIILKQC